MALADFLLYRFLASSGREGSRIMLLMADKKPTDRHKKKPLQMRLHDQLRAQLELLVERNASNLTAEITIAIRERLTREGLWPPPPKK